MRMAVMLEDGVTHPDKPSWRLRFVASPWFAAATAAVAALVGLLGSVYQIEIAASFPINFLGPFDAFSWRALIFWSALVGLAGLVYVRQMVDDEIRTVLMRSTSAAETTSRRIEDFVQTLPPRAFQAEFARAVADVHDAVSAGVPRGRACEASPDDLRQIVRSILQAIAQLGERPRHPRSRVGCHDHGCPGLVFDRILEFGRLTGA